MKKQAVIGVDIGTTGCRAAIHRPDGRLLASQAREYPLLTPRPEWAEQDPDIIYQKFCEVVSAAVSQAGLAPEEVAGLSFSAVFHSFLAVDRDGEALCPLLTWADNRSQQAAERLKKTVDGTAVYRRTGCPLHPMYPLAKIAWLAAERPDLFRRAAKFVSIKEYIVHRLTGRFAVDRSIASGTGLYNFNTLEWDEELLAVLGIGAERLSAVHSPAAVLPGIRPEAAAALGISPATPLVLGAGDGAMASLGSGVVRPGLMAATVGTSGAVRMLSPRPLTDEQGRTWCYNLNDDYWMVGAAINNGGIALRWVRDEIAECASREAAATGADAYDLLSGYARAVPAGSEGLIALPLFTGERAPYWNADARGILFGLTLTHTKRHIVRAILEGVVYRMYSIFAALESVAGPAEEVRASGSFTRSPLWVQIMADTFGRPVKVPGEPEGAAFGASAFGMVALGLLPDLAAIGQLGAVREVFRPDAANTARYSELYGIFTRVYRNLQKEFSDIASIQRGT